MLKGILIRSNRSQGVWDEGYDSTHHYDLVAEVVQVGDLSGMSGLWVDRFELSEVKVKVGDTVMMLWHGIDSANVVTVNGEKLYRVLYEDVVGIIKDGKIDPVAGHVIFTGKDRFSGKVVAVAKDVKWWEKDGIRYQHDYPDVGDYVFVRGGLHLENEMYQIFDEKMFVTQTKDIKVSSDKEILNWFQL